MQDSLPSSQAARLISRPNKVLQDNSLHTAHVPERQCAGCGNHFPKTELIRIVKIDGRACTDRNGKVQSRGIYLCRKAECIKRVQKSGRISRQLGVGTDASLFEEIAALAAESD